jgi:hypothetical protein
MSLDSLIFLLEFYWPFLIGAALVGVATGWFSYESPRPDRK